MAITTTAHQKMKDWLQSKLVKGTYTIGGVVNDMPIHSISQAGDVITVQFYLDDTVNGTITKFQVIDTEGAVWDDQPDNITKPTINGLLITFKYTLQRI
jgi:hypothetical protein